MKVLKFNNYINEDLDVSTSNKYTDLKEEVKEMIKKSLKSEDDKLYKDFIDASIKNPEETQIEGLINDSDVYEFYLKWRNDIDEVLSDINYYDEVPSELKVFSLYDYLIKGTLKSVSELIKMLE